MVVRHARHQRAALARRSSTSPYCHIVSDSNFAKLSSEVNHTFGSSLAGVCPPRAIASSDREHP